ncbi:MAG: hypothetical protein DCC67_00330 [Planctomycetota bacterium]|nr:MAG: hypothetical protein DCC67_00330 [Planctomycetota bacterium]
MASVASESSHAWNARRHATATSARLRRWADRPWVAAALLGTTSLCISAALSVARWPMPAVHDEFSYLLAADTFCEGRLTNPPHPHWQHFETFHVIQQPTYASKYPPGQGLFLALGQRITGRPIAGVWVETALATVACYWMLLGWTSRRWAAVGGALFAVHPSYQLYWGQSYWGGTAALLAAALVFGAALRMRWRCRAADAVCMASGAVLLAVTRPFEGFVFCLLTGLWVLSHYLRRGLPGDWRQFVVQTVAPQAAVLGLGMGALFVYHQAVTGDPLTFPYAVHERTYGQSPLFIGRQPSPPPTYRHAMIEKFHSGWELDWVRRQQSLAGWLQTKWRFIAYDAEFFFPGLLGLPALLLAATPLRRGWGRATPALVISLASFAISLAAIWNFPHYAAPTAPLLLMAVVAGLRRADVMARRRFGWRFLVVGFAAIQVLLFAAKAVDHAARPVFGWWAERAAIQDQLEATPRRHLVFVEYDASHDPNAEWVYNRADIDRAKVVWARKMDPASDASLARHFADRTVWLVEPDARRLRRLSSEQ